MSKGRESPYFTNANFEVCNYCKNIALGARERGDGWNYGCGKSLQKDGACEQLSPFLDFGGPINPYYGCESFEPSGLPAHPSVHKKLIRANPLAKNIPVDEKALETSWDFGIKMTKYPHVECDASLRPLKSL